MFPSVWLFQASPDTSSLPPWWPIAAVVVPLIVAIVVAFIQMSGAVKSAKIAAEAKEKGSGVPPEAIAEEVARVLGVELDKRLGTEAVAEAQAAFAKGREEAETAAREVIEAHEKAIQELQAQLAAKEAEPVGGQSEKLAATMLYNAGFDAHRAGTLGEAIGLYSAAIKLDPAYAKAYYNRGNAKFDLGDKRGAIEDYDEAIHHDPSNPKSFYNCGNAKSDIGDHAGAIADYNECIRLDPEFVHAYYNRGNSKSAMGNGAGAIEDYEQAARLDPTFAAAFYNIACEKAKIGDGIVALEHLGRAVELDSRWAKQARSDPDFAAISENPAFQGLLAEQSIEIKPPQPS